MPLQLTKVPFRTKKQCVVICEDPTKLQLIEVSLGLFGFKVKAAKLFDVKLFRLEKNKKELLFISGDDLESATRAKALITFLHFPF